MNILKGLFAPVLVSVFLSACSTAPADYTQDKYYTWVDDQGRVQHTLIKKEENPLLKPQADTVPPENNSVVDTAIKSGQTDKKLLSSDSSLEKDEIAIISDNSSAPDKALNIATSVDKTDAVSQDSNNDGATTTERKTRKYNATEINEDDYIDGDELAKNNYVRPGDEQRYYTWVDGEGRMVNSPYDPNDTEVVSDNKVVKRFVTPLKPEVSKAIISSAQSRSPFKVDPKASEIFGLASNLDNPDKWYQSILTDRCCTDLSYEVITELDMDENMLIELNFMSEKHEFNSGESAYEVVLLPVAGRDYFLRLRTFFKDAVFIPTLVFLDENLKPTRVIQDIALTYTKETGSSYAYLEGIMNVEYQTKQERFFVVLTTDSDMEKVTIVDTKKQKLKQITHAPLGSLGIFVYQ